MGESQYRPIQTYSPYSFPPGGRIVAILKAYLDDSGDSDGPSETFLTIGGYLGDLDGWQYFEAKWGELLSKYEIPWLHMKEFKKENATFAHLKADPVREGEFMAAAAQIIRESARGHVATTVLLDDFRAFNAAQGLDLDPYALAIYGCLFQLRSYHPNDEIEIIIDTFDKSLSRTAKALEYAKSDTQDGLRPDLFIPVPLQKEDSWRTVLPLQAADLMAWETRKYRRERSHLRPPMEIRGNRQAMHEWISAWEAEQEKKPRDRASFQALRQGIIFRPLHIVVDTYELNAVIVRHPNGWGA